jgi:hypothetical protein
MGVVLASLSSFFILSAKARGAGVKVLNKCGDDIFIATRKLGDDSTEPTAQRIVPGVNPSLDLPKNSTSGIYSVALGESHNMFAVETFNQTETFLATGCGAVSDDSVVDCTTGGEPWDGGKPFTRVIFDFVRAVSLHPQPSYLIV